jgi:hypothetical protein
MAKLTVLHGNGSRVLPAYAKGNYISLLPGQSRSVEIVVPDTAATGPLNIALRGWNIEASSTIIAP